MSAADKSPYRYIPRVAAVVSLIATVLFGAPPVFTQRLAIRHYGVPDGLAHSGVRSIYQDAKVIYGSALTRGLAVLTVIDLPTTARAMDLPIRM